MFSNSLWRSIIDGMNKVLVGDVLLKMPPRWREIGKAGQAEIVNSVEVAVAWCYGEAAHGDLIEYMQAQLEGQTIAYGVMRKGWKLKRLPKTPKGQRPFCVAVKPNGESCKAKAKRGYDECNKHELQRERAARTEFRARVPNAGEVLKGLAVLELSE